MEAPAAFPMSVDAPVTTFGPNASSSLLTPNTPSALQRGAGAARRAADFARNSALSRGLTDRTTFRHGGSNHFTPMYLTIVISLFITFVSALVAKSKKDSNPDSAEKAKSVSIAFGVAAGVVGLLVIYEKQSSK